MNLGSPCWVKNQSGTLVITTCRARDAGVLKGSICTGDDSSKGPIPALVRLMFMPLKVVKAQPSLPSGAVCLSVPECHKAGIM